MNYHLFVPSTLFIVGPTASGKSDLAMRLAKKLGGELVCADSQTVRLGMNLGTAKPSKQDQKTIPHHLLDIVEPYQPFSAAEFKRLAEVAIASIQKRGKLPIVVGGTGLYVDALFYDYSFIASPKNEALRTELASKSVDELQQLIAKQSLPMPQNSKNPRHLIRTLESGGIKATDKTPRPGAVIVGLLPEKEELVQRISARVQNIFKRGFLKEVQQLVETYGSPPASPQAFDAIAYKLTMQYLAAGAPLSDLEQLQTVIVHAEKNYTKRQVTWFKRNVHTQWFAEPDSAYNFVLSLF